MKKVFLVSYNKQADSESSCVSGNVSIHKTKEGAIKALKAEVENQMDEKGIGKGNPDIYYYGANLDTRVSVYNNDDNADYFSVFITEMVLEN